MFLSRLPIICLFVVSLTSRIASFSFFRFFPILLSHCLRFMFCLSSFTVTYVRFHYCLYFHYLRIFSCIVWRSSSLIRAHSSFRLSELPFFLFFFTVFHVYLIFCVFISIIIVYIHFLSASFLFIYFSRCPTFSISGFNFSPTRNSPPLHPPPFRPFPHLTSISLSLSRGLSATNGDEGESAKREQRKREHRCRQQHLSPKAAHQRGRDVAQEAEGSSHSLIHSFIFFHSLTLSLLYTFTLHNYLVI